MRRALAAGCVLACVAGAAAGQTPPLAGPGAGASAGAGVGQGAGQVAPSAPDTWVPRGAAELILLDKLRAQPTTVVVKVGDSATFGSLAIAVKGCDVRPPDLPANATAFLDITDSRGSAPEFRGWVLSNTPAVSQYQHPVYDLRLVGCH